MQADADTAIISASKLQNLLSHSASKPSRLTQNAPKARNNLGAKPPASVSSRTVGVKVPRPTSASKMQYKTTSSEIGKHTARTRKPPTGLNSKTVQRHQEKQQEKSRLQKTKSLNRSQSSDSERSYSGAKKQPLVRSLSAGSRSNMRTNSSQSKRSQDVESMSWSSDDRESGVADLVDSTERLVLTESASGSRTEEDAMMESLPFLLKKDG